jgi:4-amino-4-deoxy-L-arabinose transferase-like glycosyltransferase
MTRHKRVVIATGLFAIAQLILVIGGYADSVLCDGAFYYFQISNNAAAGNGFTFDGLYSTNGFHPLLGWLGVPVFAVFDSPWLPIRIMLCVLGLATAATGYVLFRIGRSIGDERAGELMALLFLLSPFAWIIPLNGCEGGLVVLCVALVIWQAARMREIDTRSAAVLGALVGLAGLARTDNVFLAVGVFGWLLTRTRQPRPLVAFIVAAALVVSPWLIWNVLRFGTIMQVSGAAKLALHHHHPLPSGVRNVLPNLYEVAAFPTQYMVGELMLPRRWTAAFVIANAAIVAIAVTADIRRRIHSALVPLAVLVVLHIVYYVFVQRSYFSWYVMPLVLGVAVLSGERLARASRRRVGVVLVASALMCIVTLGFFFERYPREVHAREHAIVHYLAAIEQLPPGARAGSWNSGAVGYFGTIRRPDVSIINLDCLVNNELFAAYQRGEYTAWVVANVEWLVDRPARPLDTSVVVHVRGVLSRIVADRR